MAIFDGLELSIESAAEALLAAREGRNLAAPWSIAELRPSAGDYRALAHFVGETLGVEELQLWLKSRDDGPGGGTRAESTGLVLLAAFAEHGRRKSKVRDLYPCLVQLTEHRPLVRKFLFTPAGQPTPEVWAAIEGAARTFGLRHAFDEEDEQRFYGTVTLQFGIPFGELASELPGWFTTTQEPKAIGKLRRDEVLKSSTFETLWLALTRAVLDPKRAHAIASDSPWVPPGLVEALLHAARLLTPAARPAPTAGQASDQDPEDGAEAELLLVSPPWLDWPSAGRPRFVARLLELALQGSFADELRVLANGEACTTLLRQQDGSYRAMSGTDFELPAERSVLLSLGEEGVLAEDQPGQVLELLDEESGIGFFSRSTRERLETPDLRSLLAGKVAMVVPRGAQIQPIPVERRLLGDGYLAIALGDSEATAVEVRVGDEVLWASDATVSLRAKDKSARHRPAPPDFQAYLLDGGRRVRLDDTFTAEQRQLESCSLVARSAERTAVWKVSSARCVGNTSDRLQRLRHTTGLGEPLLALYGGSPLLGHAKEHLLAAAVVDHGAICDAVFQRQWRLELRRHLDPALAWEAVCWHANGEVKCVPAAVDGLYACVDAPSDVRAIALRHSGARLGVWWSESWSHALPDTAPAPLARLLRWMRLPILGAAHLADVRAWAVHHAEAVLPAWLARDGTGNGNGNDDLTSLFPPPTGDEAWLAAVREVFRDATIEEAVRTAIAALLGERGVVEALRDIEPDWLAQLAARQPYMAARDAELALGSQEPDRHSVARRILAQALSKRFGLDDETARNRLVSADLLAPYERLALGQPGFRRARAFARLLPFAAIPPPPRLC